PRGTGEGTFAPPCAFGIVLVQEMFELWLGHHPVGVEDARLRVEQVDRPRVRPDLGQVAQPSQWSGRVEDRPARTRSEGLVDDAATEERLTSAEPGDHRGQAGAVADL